jgi:hypothetical protein
MGIIKVLFLTIKMNETKFIKLFKTIYTYANFVSERTTNNNTKKILLNQKIKK